MIKPQEIKYLSLFFILLVVWGTLGAVFYVKTTNWAREKSNKYLYEAEKSSNASDKLLLTEKAALLSPGRNTYLAAGVAAAQVGDNQLARHYLERVKSAQGYASLADAYFAMGQYELAAANYTHSLSLQSDSTITDKLGQAEAKQGKTAAALTHLAPGSELWGLLNTENMTTNVVAARYNALNILGYPQSANALLTFAREKGLLNRDMILVLASREIEASRYQAAYDYLQQAKVIDAYYPQIYTQLITVCEKLGKNDEAKSATAFLKGLSV
jgi:tetratricopeptide (TPR) repeat protein